MAKWPGTQGASGLKIRVLRSKWERGRARAADVARPGRLPLPDVGKKRPSGLGLWRGRSDFDWAGGAPRFGPRTKREGLQH